MDFLRYAESAAALVNAPLADREGLVAYLDGRQWLQEQVTDRDFTVVRRFQKDLRPVFQTSVDGDVAAVVETINNLLVKHPVTPMISDHDPDNLHLHVANRAASVSDLLIGEALMGLATVICDLGATRLGVCTANNCEKVFVDTSPNASRRYCSDRCSSRANVAAYRARRRAEKEA